ncbi:hypothetical protein N7462_006861 [Penicillium macrosclerotiorum]|uniref:uncharacterized protein n=1 Tax=Penicillium macrosclerotiorum TaxID=303699 RepID=UPI002546B29A|nr:uncharacterized protein N7462_006861 [Penicillium macrosclerotiorum]KAJ5678617.1 hypothetical protein N7462_006861 [Penicillium macrosclerotiorum]
MQTSVRSACYLSFIWKLTSIKAFGLDPNLNPDLSLFPARETRAASEPTLRDVDWRDGPKELRNGYQRRAAMGQRSGETAPKGQECKRCIREHGVFRSCVVCTVDGELQFGGACMNCAFTKEGYRCSLPPREVADVALDTSDLATASPFLVWPGGGGPSWAGLWYTSPFEHPEHLDSLDTLFRIHIELSQVQARVAFDLAQIHETLLCAQQNEFEGSIEEDDSET